MYGQIGNRRPTTTTSTSTITTTTTTTTTTGERESATLHLISTYQLKLIVLDCGICGSRTVFYIKLLHKFVGVDGVALLE